MQALLVLSVFVACTCAPLYGQHAGDVWIGISSSGSLKPLNVPEAPIKLPPVSSGPFSGWASNTLGFDAIVNADTEGDTYPVGPGADLYIEVVSIDPGLSLRSFTAFTVIYVDEPGEQLRIGPTGSLHWHPISFIDGQIVGPSFRGTRNVAFKLVDLGAASYTESPVYQMVFSTPEVPTTGDFNGDGIVNLADYTVWRDSLGAIGSDSPADGDDSGVVDEADYQLWKSTFGTGSTSNGAQSVAVPEPASVVLLALLASLRGPRRKFFRKRFC